MVQPMLFSNGAGRNNDSLLGATAAIACNEEDVPSRCESPSKENDAQEMKRVKRIKSEPTLVTLDEDSVAAVPHPNEHQAQEEGKDCGFFIGGKDDATEGTVHDTAVSVSSVEFTTIQDRNARDKCIKMPEPKFGTAPSPETCDPDMDPDAFLQALIQAHLGFAPKIRPALGLPEAFFPRLNEDHLAAYGVDVVNAVRENDFNAVKVLHAAGRSLACCNRFGESLLHMACRRGYVQVFHFLLEEANVDVRIRDDCGRTPLHDACWNCDMQYEIVDALLRSDPSLLFIGDKRGHTPFAYARREHWALWRQFLHDRVQYIVQGMGQREVREIFGGVE